MRRAQNPRSTAFAGSALVASVALLVWFTVIVQQAQTRGQHRRAYQQLTGEIMMQVPAEARRSSGHLQGAKTGSTATGTALALALAQR